MTASIVPKTIDPTSLHEEFMAAMRRGPTSSSKVKPIDHSEADRNRATNNSHDTDDVMPDENDMVQETTKAQQEHGESLHCHSFFRDPAKYEPYLDGLMKSLHKRESMLGRYNHVTALTYASLANAFRNLQQEARAVALYRTQYRIQIILYGKTNGPIGDPLHELLLSRGLSKPEIISLQKDLVLSTKHEVEGDWFRKFGHRRQALVEYQKAVRMEEYSFGRDNPDLAFLWRKMACLAAIKKGLFGIEAVDNNVVYHTERGPGTKQDTSLLLDFELADRIGNQWMRQARKLLSSGICSLIRRGDHYCCLLLYSHAVGEYYKASSAALANIHPEQFLTHQYTEPLHPKTRRKESSKSRKHQLQQDQKETPSFSQPPMTGEKITDELHQLIQQEAHTPTAANRQMNASDDALSFSIHSLVESGKKQEATIEHLEQTKQRDHNAEPVDHATADSHFRISPLIEPQKTKRSDTYRPGTDPTKRESPMLRRGRKPAAVDPNPPSDSSLVSTLSESSRPKPGEPKKNKGSNSSRRKPRSTRSSTSLPSFRRSSIRTLESTIDEEESQPKPKSDSYLSKIANRTRKVASKTSKMAKRQLQKGKTTFKDMSSKASDISRRKNRSIWNENETEKQSAESKGTSTTKNETSYSVLASPPMTPFHRPLKTAGELQRAGSPFANSTDGFLDAFTLLDPSTETHHSPPQAESIDNSTGLVGNDLRGSGDNQTSIEVFGGPLDQYLSSHERGAIPPVRKPSTMSSPHGKTSDETAPTDNRTGTTDRDPSPSSPLPSLVELVADVQSMNALLQRKTVRLQHRLAVDLAASPPDDRTRSAVLHAMSKGTKEFYGEVQDLFDDCQSKLEIANAILKNPKESHNNAFFGTMALEEYRKKFTLEKAFLDELGRKLRHMVPPAESKKEK